MKGKLLNAWKVEARGLFFLAVVLLFSYIWFATPILSSLRSWLMTKTLGLWPGIFAALVTYGAGFAVLKNPHFLTRTASGWILLLLYFSFVFFFFRPFIRGALLLFPAFFLGLSFSAMVISFLLPSPLKTTKLLRAAIVFFWLMPFVVASSIAVVYNGTDRCQKMLQNRKVHVLFSFCNLKLSQKMLEQAGLSKDLLRSVPQARSIFLSSSGQVVFAGTGVEDAKERQLLLAIDRRTRKILKAFKMPTPWAGFCFKGQCLITVSPQKDIYLLDEKRLRIARAYRTPFRSRFMAADQSTGKVYIPGSLANGIVVAKLPEGTFQHYAFQVPKLSTFAQAPAVAAVFDSDKSTLFIAAEKYLDIPCLHVFRFSASKPLFSRSCFSFQDALLSLGLPVGLTFSKKRQEVYISFPLEGSIYVLDRRTLHLKQKINVSVGIRELSFDPLRLRILAGHYLDGYVYVIDPQSGKTKEKIFVGRRIRSLHYEPSIDRILVTSANGFLEAKLSLPSMGSR